MKKPSRNMKGGADFADAGFDSVLDAGEQTPILGTSQFFTTPVVYTFMQVESDKRKSESNRQRIQLPDVIIRSEEEEGVHAPSETGLPIKASTYYSITRSQINDMITRNPEKKLFVIVAHQHSIIEVVNIGSTVRRNKLKNLKFICLRIQQHMDYTTDESDFSPLPGEEEEDSPMGGGSSPLSRPLGRPVEGQWRYTPTPATDGAGGTGTTDDRFIIFIRHCPGGHQYPFPGLYVGIDQPCLSSAKIPSHQGDDNDI